MVNSLIKGSECEKETIRWKLNHCKGMKDVQRDVAKLGDSWFRGFIKNFPELQITRQSDVNMNRDSWCTYHNLRDMYELLFRYWTIEGYCSPLPAPQWQDRFGNVVDVNDPNRLGRKVWLEWIHGNWMLCFDKVCIYLQSIHSDILSCSLLRFSCSDFRVNPSVHTRK